MVFFRYINDEGEKMKRNRVLYLEVADKIKADIFSGKYPVGSMLPTENELEELFDVSKITVRKAIELLASDEYVQKKSGKGTTVLSDRPYNKLSRADSFTQILETSNFDVQKLMIDVSRVTLTSEDNAYKYFGKDAIFMERLYLLDQQPYIYFKHFLPFQLADLSENEFKDDSLYRLMNQKGFEIVSFEDAFSAVILTKEQKEKLATKEDLGILRTRKSIDLQRNVVEYSEAIYDTKQHPYLIKYEV